MIKNTVFFGLAIAALFFQSCGNPNTFTGSVSAASANQKIQTTCQFTAGFVDSLGQAIKLPVPNEYVIQSGSETLTQCQQDFTNGTSGAFQNAVQSYCNSKGLGGNVFYILGYNFNDGVGIAGGQTTTLYECPHI